MKWVMTILYCVVLVVLTASIIVLVPAAPAHLYSVGPRWVLWCVDDDGRIVPLTPELVRRGRVCALEWGAHP